MPASRSTSRDSSPRRPYWPLIPVGLLAALTFVIVALPAALVVHFLPPSIGAAELSGSIWHGSIGRLTVGGRDAGALEWRLQPASLLTLAPTGDLHWVKARFVVDGRVSVDRRGVRADAVRGGGPIEDLTDLGIAPGWRGDATIALREAASDPARVSVLAGDVSVSGVASASIGAGAPLGGYVLHFADDAVGADGSVAGTVKDLGGPIRIDGTLKLSPAERTGSISATLKEGADIDVQLRAELNNLAQMRGRTPDGRIPVELEFTY